MTNKLLKISGFLVKQLTYKPIATSSISFNELKEIVKFTSREPSSFDPFDPIQNKDLFTTQANHEYFQRLTSEERVINIYKYLLEEINKRNTKKSELGTFPTSVIISIDINEQFDNEEEYKSQVLKLEENDIIGAFYKITDESKYINFEILNRKNSLIVDGQHRLAAMLKLYNDAKNKSIKIGRYSLDDKYPNLEYNTIISELENFQLNCTLLVGFDKWEQGKVFVDVNFNQKPVNKSLYYDIFGSYPEPDKNDIFLAHMLAMHLNNNSNSVIKGFIKMLGKGSGYFSQAFFVESILEHFKANGIWADIPLDYLSNGKKYEILPLFLKAYFRSIKKNFTDYWPKSEYGKGEKYKDVLVKTTGMGALLKLMNPIYKQLIRNHIQLNKLSEDELFYEFNLIFAKIKDHGGKYFSSSSDFSGAGSLGLQNKLYKELGTELGFFKK
ncbi:DGQHR domain-containing protein [Chryseobacterium luquanense]|uniref:DGQHR domain-containing protein n=1 Tax=Chryseobacterium luquanense TaxID=2983766 RepID=A0ABT3XY85_9FLAO|nr:DGQHR domain-containing protein [Chryseobacterium luquanense]MCX8530858.1 DGQHR domain-containing protein [Chryseobacterium luquanense]